MEKNGNLILTRQVNQQIVIADGEIVLTVKRIQGNRVTIGISAARQHEQQDVGGCHLDVALDDSL